MHTHPTPNEMRYYATLAMREVAEAWEAETGKLFPVTVALRGMNDGVDTAIAEHEAMKARLHNTRAA